MDQPQPLYVEWVQIGPDRERSHRRLPGTADPHLRRLDFEELPLDRAGQGTVPDGRLQSLQPSAVRESWQHEHRFQCSEHRRESGIRNREWSFDHLTCERSFAPKHYGVRDCGHCDYAIRPQPGISVLDPIYLLTCLKPKRNIPLATRQRDVSLVPLKTSPSVRVIITDPTKAAMRVASGKKRV